MNDFKSFGIKTNHAGFTGDKIKIGKILNKTITVEDYRIADSKYKEKGNGKCLYMQIIMDGTKYVVFTGSTILQQMIQKVEKKNIPFTTIVVRENEWFEFT